MGMAEHGRAFLEVKASAWRPKLGIPSFANDCGMQVGVEIAQNLLAAKISLPSQNDSRLQKEPSYATKLAAGI